MCRNCEWKDGNIIGRAVSKSVTFRVKSWDLIHVLTQWPLRDMAVILQVWISNPLYRIVAGSLVKLFWGECHWTSLMTSQHWSWQWLGAVRQQAITWTNVDQDLCGHMVSLGHDELNITEHMFMLWSHKTYYTSFYYCKTCNISHTLLGNEIVDHSDVVGASPAGTAPTTSSFSP